MKVRIHIEKDSLSAAILDMLESYEKDVAETTDKVAKRIAQEDARELRESESTPELTGVYKSHWSSKQIHMGEYDIYVRPKEYRLTHLLERGHLTRDGRTRSKSFIHIAPVEQKAIKDFEQELKKELSK